MHYLTIQEQERLAYAEGYTETAAVLARLDDAHAALGDEISRTFALDDERDGLQRQIDDMRDERDGLRDELELARASYRDALKEADEWHDQVKTLRAALMALESEVSSGMRAFIREVLE